MLHTIRNGLLTVGAWAILATATPARAAEPVDPDPMDVLRFKPVKTRHVRIHCTERAVNWQAYTIYELAVFASLPQYPAAKEPRQ